MKTFSTRQIESKNGVPYTCREATIDDANAFIDLVKAIFHTTPFTLTSPDEFRPTLEDQQHRIQQYQKSDAAILLLVEIEGKIVGNIEFSAHQKRRIQHQGEFGMGILEAYRNRGIGSILVYQLLTWAQRNPKIEKVCLSVFENNESAIHLYQKFGFLEEGRQHKAIKQEDGSYVDLINMYRYV